MHLIRKDKKGPLGMKDLSHLNVLHRKDNGREQKNKTEQSVDEVC